MPRRKTNTQYKRVPGIRLAIERLRCINTNQTITKKAQRLNHGASWYMYEIPQ